MNARRLILILIPLLFSIGCQRKYSFTDISTFTIDTTALKNGEQVSIFYFSGGPEDNKLKGQYYYRYIVASMETGDTVNVLCPVMFDLSNENYIKYFHRNDSEISLIVQNLDKIGTGSENIRNMSPKNITQVVCNHHYKKVEHNHYPTTIGIFAETVTQTKPTNILDELEGRQ